MLKRELTPNFSIYIAIVFIVWSLINYPSNVHSQEQPNTVTFINQSGESALVKLMGPTSLLVEVPNGTSRTVNVAAGEYYELVRYGSQSSHYTYSKGKPFAVEQTATQYSEISITLHKVVGGNYPTHPISGKEFDDAFIAQQTSDKKPLSKGLTNKSDPPSQTQLLPWALNRFFDLMNETPSKVDEARMRLQQDLDGKQVEIPLVMGPSSDPYEIEQSPSKSFLAGINEGNDLAILYPHRTFKVSSGERISDIDKSIFDKITHITGKALVVWSGQDAEPKDSAYSFIVMRKGSGVSGTRVVRIYIVDATWRETPQKDMSIEAVPAEDKAEAVRRFRKAAEQGDAKAQYNLGAAYYKGEGVSQDKAEAVRWIRKAAEQGFAKAQTSLGMAYYKGEGVSKDNAEAVKWYRKAAEQGHADGQHNLGMIYYLGEGVSQDNAEAVKWYRKAAEQGHAGGQYFLGLMYDYGEGVSQDKAEAVKWYRKAAEQGHADGQHSLGEAYYKGEGVTQDKAEAVRWIRKAAEQGFAKAQTSLGVAYYLGEGVSQDNAEAVKWYRKAADQGFAGGQYNLGVMYAKGLGVSRDKAEAIKWVRKAAEQGHENAKKLLPILSSFPY
jgi:TPR repeat protein